MFSSSPQAIGDGVPGLLITGGVSQQGVGA